MLRYLAAYAATAAACAALDLIWIGVIAHRFYYDRIGSLIYPQPRLGPAAAFYLLYAAGVVVFVVMPAVRVQAWPRAVLGGVFFGIVAYGTYDLTNLATMKGFTATVALVDMAWGAVLTATAAVVGYSIAKRV